MHDTFDGCFGPPDGEPVEVEPFTRITVPMCFYWHTGDKSLRRLFAVPWYKRLWKRLFG